MRKTLLLTILVLLTFSLTSFGQVSQKKIYKIRYFKAYTEGELTTSTPGGNEVFVFDEGAGKIEIKNGEGYQNRILRIQRKGPDPVHKDCTIYFTEMPMNNGQGLACVIIVLDKFYKAIKFADCATNQEGLRNYMEFQYE